MKKAMSTEGQRKLFERAQAALASKPKLFNGDSHDTAQGTVEAVAERAYLKGVIDALSDVFGEVPASDNNETVKEIDVLIVGGGNGDKIAGKK